ncbi:hypothetical protein QVD17_22870 [Tagetes erecta]|uniref:Uncharacterized protein n=1 Tax=Tagetes erecta TaxID=13708 RepID=A0AAD8KGI3_TARER|nr:hypothetical protein QVD17_22870 [Tagetes erecta]
MKATSAVAPSPIKPLRLSPWHTPVPYFFGGLAVLLGLIAFALLMLACSYENLSGDIENDVVEDRDLEAGESKPDKDHDQILVFEEKYVVIMAGKETPTFLATPVSGGAGIVLGRCTCSCGSNLTEKTSEEKEQ